MNIYSHSSSSVSLLSRWHRLLAVALLAVLTGGGWLQ